MANDSSAQDRNLPASQRKIKRAREDGTVVRSRDLGHFVAIASGGAVLVATAPWWTEWMRHMLADGLRFDVRSVASNAAMGQRLSDLTLFLLGAVVPAGALTTLVALGGSLVVGGWNWTLKPMAPKFSKMNPLSGLGRLFSKQQLTDTLKACLLALLLGTVGTLYLKSHLGSFHSVIAMALPAALQHVGQTVIGGLLLLLLVLALFAAVDVPLQRHLHAQQLKMSTQEMKQEHKENEGNAEVKAKVKQRMREMSRRRMLAAVPTADLVVMNPTHYAVALKYDEHKMMAPRVVAKGADLLAMKIRDTARGAKVPVLQSPVLARALYAHAEVDREIPAALFAAVAQVLAYVYQLRTALAGGLRSPGEPPNVYVPAELDPANRPGPASENDAP